MYLISLALVATSLCATEIDAKKRFEELFAQYSTVTAFHLEADYITNFYFSSRGERLQEPTVIPRSNSYWANNFGSYRSTTKTAPYAEFAGSVYDFGFNGELYQFFNHPDSIFSFGRTNEIRQNPASPENPLFSPSAFLSKDVDGCRACVLTLLDILNVEAQSKVISSARVISGPEEAELVVELPGGFLLQRRFTFQVHFGTTPAFLPTRIVWMTANGPLKTMDIDYQRLASDAGEVYWPKRVHIRGTPGKDVSDETIIEVRSIEMDPAIPRGIFDIDFASANSVWNYDTKSFVKQGPNSRSRQGVDEIVEIAAQQFDKPLPGNETHVEIGAGDSRVRPLSASRVAFRVALASIVIFLAIYFWRARSLERDPADSPDRGE